jgi:hypothetical protein
MKFSIQSMNSIPQFFWVRHNGVMGEFFRLGSEPKLGGPKVTLGVDAPGIPKLTIPSMVRQTATYKELGLVVDLVCEIADSRLEISEMKIRAQKGVLATSLFTQLKLPQVLRRIGLTTITNADFYTKELQRNSEDKIADDAFIAQVYALEYACWGSPRDTLMKYLGWSRTNTNLHLRRISQVFPLPGPKRVPVQRTTRRRQNKVVGSK